MDKVLFKIKIFLTNVSRIIMSFLFVNLNFGYINKVAGAVWDPNSITCYDTAPQPTNTLTLKHIFIILVPLAIIIGFVILMIKKKKSKSKEEKKDAKKD